MVNQPKIYKLFDLGFLSISPLLTGALIFLVQWSVINFTDLTLNLLPKSLETYTFLEGILEAYGLGFLGIIGALLISYISDDTHPFDNIGQMAVGLIIGLVLTIVIGISQVFSMGEYLEIAYMLEGVILTIYGLVRFFVK